IFSPGEVGSLTGQVSGIHLEYGTKDNLISGNSIASSSTNGRSGWLIREEAMGDAGPNYFTGNVLITKGTLAVTTAEILGGGTVYSNHFSDDHKAYGAAYCGEVNTDSQVGDSVSKRGVFIKANSPLNRALTD